MARFMSLDELKRRLSGLNELTVILTIINTLLWVAVGAAAILSHN